MKAIKSANICALQIEICTEAKCFEIAYVGSVNDHQSIKSSYRSTGQ